VSESGKRKRRKIARNRLVMPRPQGSRGRKRLKTKGSENKRTTTKIRKRERSIEEKAAVEEPALGDFKEKNGGGRLHPRRSKRRSKPRL